jgi:hypothetical protein
VFDPGAVMTTAEIDIISLNPTIESSSKYTSVNGKLLLNPAPFVPDQPMHSTGGMEVEVDVDVEVLVEEEVEVEVDVDVDVDVDVEVEVDVDVEEEVVLVKLKQSDQIVGGISVKLKKGVGKVLGRVLGR